jgi:hypothetical protein
MRESNFLRHLSGESRNTDAWNRER